MRDKALQDGWHPVDALPRPEDGQIIVLTLSGLIRRARIVRQFPRIKPADGYGPERVSVTAVESGNYLAAIAWKWPDSES